MPVLWSTLHYIGYGGYEDVSVFRAFLERSADMLLTVQMHLSRPKTTGYNSIHVTPSSAIILLGAHIHRCQELTLSSNEMCEWDFLGHKRSPFLTQLTIPRPPSAHADAWILADKKFAPSLRKLVIDGLTFWFGRLPSFSPSLLDFTGLDIDMSRSSGFPAFVRVMKTAPNLERLRLSTDGLEPLIQPRVSLFTFPRLRSLTICGGETRVFSLLSYISAPSLIHLSLQDCSLQLYESFMLQSEEIHFPSVTRLELWDIDPILIGEKHWHVLSSGLPSITHLRTNLGLPSLTYRDFHPNYPFPLLRHVIVDKTTGREACEFVQGRTVGAVYSGQHGSSNLRTLSAVKWVDFTHDGENFLEDNQVHWFEDERIWNIAFV